MRIQVVAAVLRDPAGRVLLAERCHEPEFEGFWEFPGGKVETTESRGDALQRELAEELGIQCADFEPLISIDHDYPHRRVRIHFFLATTWKKEIRPLDGQDLRWVFPHELNRQELMPANEPVVAVLQALANSPAWQASAHGW